MKIVLKRSLLMMGTLSCAAAFTMTGCNSPRTGGFETEETSVISETMDASISEEATELLSSLNGITFEYSGSSGNWNTTFTMGEDGSFTGTYTDKEKTMTGKKYSKGTVYTCTFNGKFTVISKEDDLTYTLQVAKLTLEEETGQETIKKKVRYLTTNAYGIEEGDMFTLYKPQHKSSSLPDEFKTIIKTNKSLYDGLPAEINFCGLFNTTQNSGFISENYFVNYGENSYEAYLNLINHYKDDIERYNWKYSAHTRPLALGDINGDGTNELIFFTSETDEGPGILHICTYADNKAVEVTYPFADVSDGSNSALMFNDENTGSGTSYVIYKDNEDNALWIYRRYGNPDLTYSVYKYTLSEDGTLSEAYTLRMSTVEETPETETSSETDSETSVSEPAAETDSAASVSDPGSETDSETSVSEPVAETEVETDVVTDDNSQANAGITAVLKNLPILSEYYDDYYDDGYYDDYYDNSYDDGYYDDYYDDGYDDYYDDSYYDDYYYDDSYYDDGYDDYYYAPETETETEANALDDESAFYYENGKKISASDGAKAFEDAFSKLGTVLLYSSPTSDVTIWNDFEDTDVAGLSYDDMVKKLSE